MNQSKKIKSEKILFVSFLVLICLFLSSCVEKTQEEKVYRVGILTSFSPMMSIADGFKDGMAKLGYVEGKNIVYDLQINETSDEGAKKAARKLIDEKVDLIFTFPTEASVAAYKETQGTGIPVVFAMCGVEGNIPIESVSQPGINATGVRFPGPDNVVKHLEIMIELKPQIKKVWVTYDPSYPIHP